MKAVYLPSTQRFPGGYVVTIKQVAPSTLKRLANGTECYGLWDVTMRTIYVDKTASERKQRYTFAHEMDHAVNDWRHFYLGEDSAE